MFCQQKCVLGLLQLQGVVNPLMVEDSIIQWRGEASVKGEDVSEGLGLQHCLVYSIVCYMF